MELPLAVSEAQAPISLPSTWAESSSPLEEVISSLLCPSLGQAQAPQTKASALGTSP